MTAHPDAPGQDTGPDVAGGVRLFAAWYPSPEVAARVHAACGPLREAAPILRWASAAGLHCTMRFFGAVDAERAAALPGLLAEAAALFDPLPVVVRGVGAFPSWRRPRVVWAGLAPDPKFELLHHEIERRAMALGFDVEGRIFRPHLTLARLVQPGPGAAIREAARGVRLREPDVVSAVALVASRPTPRGYAHATVTTVNLGRA